MKIGIIETGEVPPELKARYGDYPDMFAAMLGAADPSLEFVTLRIVSGDAPGDPRDADAWLVTGSRHGVYDDLPWIAPLKDFLRACVAQGVPVVGICFGHQILAEALGGSAAKSDRGWVLGLQDYEVADRPSWMTHVPDRFAMHALHQDQVLSLPGDATVLARSEHCDYAAVAYGDPEAPYAISVQPHPEYNRDFIADLIALRSGTAFPTDLADAAHASLTRDVHNAAWAALIVDYLRRKQADRVAA